MRLIHDFKPAAGGTSLFGVDEGHQGLSADAETGLSYYGARYYMADVGRLVNQDPPRERSRGLTPYLVRCKHQVEEPAREGS